MQRFPESARNLGTYVTAHIFNVQMLCGGWSTTLVSRPDWLPPEVRAKRL